MKDCASGEGGSYLISQSVGSLQSEIVYGHLEMGTAHERIVFATVVLVSFLFDLKVVILCRCCAATVNNQVSRKWGYQKGHLNNRKETVWLRDTKRRAVIVRAV